MEQIIYGITIVIYGIFIIRFILSWIGGDFELDADADVDLGDVVSFKGATHFLMGFFSWLSLKLYSTHCIMWYDYILAFILGVIFVVILFYTYKLMLNLESNPTILKEKDLIGTPAKIYLSSKKKRDNDYNYLITVENSTGTFEVPAKSVDLYSIGDMVQIKDFSGSYYII
jgi:hypothetical protein